MCFFSLSQSILSRPMITWYWMNCARVWNTGVRLYLNTHKGATPSYDHKVEHAHQFEKPTGMLYLFGLSITQLYDGSRDRRFGDIAHIHLLQHLLLAQQKLRHIKGTVELFLVKFVANVAHLSIKGGSS